MNNRLLRPWNSGPDADPPAQLKTEDNLVLLSEDGSQLATE